MNYKINFCNDNKQIINVWRSVFGDSEDEILFFLNNCKNKECLGAFDNGKLVSMLFMVDCSYGTLKGKYLYAVSTLSEYRNNGIAGQLITKAKEYKNDFLWLIPADESLKSYYKKYDFNVKLYSNSTHTDEIVFNEDGDIVEYLYEGCELKEPIGMVYSLNEFKSGSIGHKNKEN